MQLQPQILIIDDEPVSAESLKALLHSEGYCLRFAADGPSGLEMAEATPPDLILLDVMMPVMDGYEVCRRIRQSSTLAEVPVVMVTALDDRESRIAGIEAGADDFISKPVNRNELRARVRTITRLNRYRRLLAQESQLRWLLEQSKDGYVQMDSSNRIVYANHKACLFLGLDPSKLEEQGDFLAKARQQYNLEPPAAWGAWEARKSHEPLYLVRPESEVAAAFWIGVDELQCNDCGPLGRLVQLRDVSAEMASVIDTAKLSRLIPHKLNTPLNHIAMSLSLLEEVLKGHPLEADATELLTIARGASQQLNESVAHIMSYMSVSMGHRQRGRLEIAEAEAVLREVGDALEFARADIRFASDGVVSRLAIERSALSLLLHEILDNARKFHPERRPVIDVSVDAARSGKVRLRVADDGVCLSPSQIERAFQPFDQAEKYATGETPGIGLGLPLVRRLIWQVGGDVRLLNREDGPGVVVEVELPAAV
ncbi:response regulator [Methylotetracoccus oryzae]|uniref:response regulator n=1 Tax=Methylotetracoccus oryzae TaxID=1919059 RepID=UPI001118A445|nr:response regulator [Methylotetracoccus oryzae]